MHSNIKSLKGCHGNAVFKFEPFVLHVQCKDLVAGQQMLKVALISGFKNSGIVIGKKANVIVAVRSTQSLEVPLVHKGELMVSYKYIEFLVKAANKKLEENQTRINRFFANLSQLLSECDDSNCTLQKTGMTRRIRVARQDELLMVHKTSQQSTLDAPGGHDNDDDALDCLVSFYGGVS